MLPTEKTAVKNSLAALTVLVYGQSKIGKSSFCAQAENALFLATEPGLNALEVYQIPIASWRELLTALAEIKAGDHAYKTIILDTVDNGYRMCSEYICAKNGVEHEADLPYGKGWALVNAEFHRVITRIAFLPCGFYMISHSQEIEVDTRTGKYTKSVPTLPDKARRLVLGMVDMILFCDLTAENGRVVRTKPDRHYEAGDRTGRLPETIDLDYAAFLAAFNGVTAENNNKQQDKTDE